MFGPTLRTSVVHVRLNVAVERVVVRIQSDTDTS